MLKNLIFLVLFIGQFSLHAQKTIIKVLNANGVPEPDAVVMISNTPESKLTDENGDAVFYSLALGVHHVQISGIDIEPQTLDISVDGSNQTFTTHVNQSNIKLEEVIINSNIIRKKEFINKLDISLRPLNNSQEVLRMVPGLFIGQHAGGGKAEQIFLRGFDCDHGTDIQINVDGMPVNMVSHAHGQGYADLHFVIPELIERVDFSKGPYQADKGNFNTAGWVDFRTKTYLENNVFKGEIGQFDTYRAFGAFNLMSKQKSAVGKSAYIAGEYNYSNSFFDAPQNFKRTNVFGKWNDKLSNNTNVSLSASYFQSDWNHSGQIPDRAVDSGLIGFFGSIDPTEGGNTSKINVNAMTITSLKNGAFWKNQVYFSKYDFELFSNFTFFLEDPVYGDQIKQKENRNIIGGQSKYVKPHTLGNKNAELTIGLQTRHDIVKDVELSKTSNRTEVRETIQFGDVNETNVSAYIEESLALNTNWTIDGGMRLEYFHNKYNDKLQPNDSGSASAFGVFPKLNFYYTASQKIQLFLKNGKGFHSNDTRVVVPQAGKQILPAAYGSDLGIVWKPTNNIIILPTLWYLWLDQEFVYVGDAGVVEPSGRTRRLGFDLTTRFQIASGLYAELDLNLTKPRAIDEPKGEQYIPLAPTITTVGGFTYMHSSGITANIRGRYLGDRPANEDNSIIAKGYFVTDLQLNYKIKDLTLGVMINNLFNTRWKETQFATETRLKDELTPVEEICFTPGSPFFARFSAAYNF